MTVPRIWVRPLTFFTGWAGFFGDYYLTTTIIAVTGDFDVSVLAWIFVSKSIVQMLVSAVLAFLVQVVRNSLLYAMVGVVLMVASSFTYCIEKSVHMWMLARVIHGVGSACYATGIFGHIQDVFGKSSVASGYMATAILSGVVLGPPLGGALVFFGRASQFIFSAVLLCGVLALLLIQTVVKPRNDDEELGGATHSSTQGHDSQVTDAGDGKATAGSGQDGRAASAPEGDTLDAVTTRSGRLMSALAFVVRVDYLSMFLSVIMANAALSGFVSTFSRLMFTIYHYGPMEIGYMDIFLTVPSLLMTLVGPLAGKKLGFMNVAIFALVVGGTSFGATPKDVISLEIIGQIGLGIGVGLYDSVVIPALNGLAKEDEVGKAVYPLFTFCSQMGFIMGPLLTSWIIKAGSTRIAFGLLGGFMAASAIPLVIVQTYKTNQRRESVTSRHRLEEKMLGDEDALAMDVWRSGDHEEVA